MAQLRNVHKIFDLEKGESIKVGHNREIRRKNRYQFIGELHGHGVVTITCDTPGETGGCHVKLDTCGWLTRTTCDAMKDFCSAFGVKVSVSMARGVFSARYDGAAVDHNGCGVISFNAERYTVAG